MVPFDILHYSQESYKTVGSKVLGLQSSATGMDRFSDMYDKFHILMNQVLLIHLTIPSVIPANSGYLENIVTPPPKTPFKASSSTIKITGYGPRRYPFLPAPYLQPLNPARACHHQNITQYLFPPVCLSFPEKQRPFCRMSLSA
jgi:hypothetical protein